jgi:hypothetical protein
VLFWAIDRFTREGMVPTILHLQRLAACGVGFHSHTEAHLATDNELVRNILLALLASLAKVEAQKTSERTRAGMARARAQGKRIGRPGIAPKLRQQIAERVAAGEDTLCRGQGPWCGPPYRGYTPDRGLSRLLSADEVAAESEGMSARRERAFRGNPPWPWFWLRPTNVWRTKTNPRTTTKRPINIRPQGIPLHSRAARQKEDDT